jgi:hypothetical protein
MELRHRRRRHGRTHPQQRALIAGRDQHDRALASLFAERILHKFADLAATLAHQAHDGQVGCRVARHHSDQRAFAHARSPEDAHALSAPHG